MIDIYSKDGQLKCRVEPGSGSEQQKALQGDNILSLSFTLYEAILLDVNDYADFCGERYWITERYLPKQHSSVEWVYDVHLSGIESLIKRFLVLQNADNENEPVFALTAPAREHAAMIVDAINKGMETTKWKVGNVNATENLTIDYEGTYCNEGLEKVAKAAGTEYWFEGTTLNICKAETGAELELGYGRGLTSLERDVADNVKFYTRLFAIGSTRNIDPARYGHSRLQLPGGQKYVDKETEKYGIIHHYEKEAFKDIYPRRIGTVSAVSSEKKKGDDGKDFTIYFFKDDALAFDPNTYDLPGLVKHVVFQSGELDGRDFEVNYDSDKKTFEIITTWPYKDGTQLPGGLLVPKTGDKYILWNLRMPDEYYPAAERELLKAVEDFNKAHYIDRSVYKAPADHVWIEETGAELTIGRRVKLYSDKYFPETGYRSSRITKITRKVTLPSQAELEISDALSTGIMDKIEDSIGAVKSYVRQSAAALPDIIRTIDDTLPTDHNLFSARRVLQDFLSKHLPGTLKELITFLKGLKIGNSYGIDAFGNAVLQSAQDEGYLPGLGGRGYRIWTDDKGRGHAEVDYMTARTKFAVNVLEAAETRYYAGNWVESGAGGRIYKVVRYADNGHGAGWRAYMNADNGEMRLKNLFGLGDQVMCKTLDIMPGVYENVSNRYYFRLITKTGQELFEGKLYNYVDISDEDMVVLTLDGVTKNCKGYDPVQSGGNVTHGDEPRGGDYIVAIGNQIDEARQSAVIHYTIGDNTPATVEYAGIDNYDLESHIVNYKSPRETVYNSDRFRLISGGNKVSLKDYVEEKAQVSIDSYQLAPSSLVINTKKTPSWKCNVVHRTNDAVTYLSSPQTGKLQIRETLEYESGATVDRYQNVGFTEKIAELESKKVKRITLALQRKPTGTTVWKEIDACEITIVQDGVDGETGQGAYAMQLTPDRLVANTNGSGVVQASEYAKLKTIIEVRQGKDVLPPGDVHKVEVAPSKLYKTSGDMVAEADGLTVKVKSIATIASGNVSYTVPFCYADITITLKDGTKLQARLHVSVNVYASVAQLTVTQNAITQQVNSFQSTVDGLNTNYTALEERTSNLEVSASGISSKVATLEATTNTLTGEVDTVKGSITEIKQSANDIELSVRKVDKRVDTVNNAVDKILDDRIAAGILIDANGVVVTGDKVKIQHSDGTQVAVFVNGKLNANLIDAGKIFAGEIDAKDAIIKNLTVTTGSQIAGFVVEQTGFRSGLLGSLGGCAIGPYTTEFLYRNGTTKIGVTIGDAAQYAASGITNHYNEADYSQVGFDGRTYYPAMYLYSLDAANGSKERFPSIIVKNPEGLALLTDGDVKCRQVMAALVMNFKYMTGSVTLSKTDCRIHCYNSAPATVTLPTGCESGKRIEIRKCGPSDITVAYKSTPQILLGDRWDGDYRITDVIRNGACVIYVYDNSNGRDVWVANWMN